eukprot:CAMPEP_0202689086 /NCGR_PEP_ID=MMETSP1385-20130828/4434_1 /ASSEMBLY_ACC=CAM_ASM_000861 /TAXON_ID=933848 /ORGANISM="Elphidium margaritaceum" /LENGTH=179 /DNA_ID=CAMNT_0049344173 /DNA_START=79 /DNA_END=618 /DNA_ORIENTATION=+
MAMPLSSTLHQISIRSVGSHKGRATGRSNLARGKIWRPVRDNKKPRVRKFDGAPQRKAIVEAVLIKQPRKPDSGKRQCIKARIRWNNKPIYSYIPWEKYPLSKWNHVLLEGFRSSNIPFVHTRCIRGKYDLPPPQTRGSANKPSRKGMPGKKVDKLKVLRTKFYRIKSNIIPDIHQYMV